MEAGKKPCIVKEVLPPEESGQYLRVPVVVGVPTTGEVICRPPDWQEAPRVVGASTTASIRSCFWSPNGRPATISAN
jgi:hypothetical protein